MIHRCAFFTATLLVGSTHAGVGGALYRGLSHTPLGNATLEIGEHLVVSNIGSSGKDGVSVDLGPAAEGFLALVDFGPAGEIAPETMFRLDGIAAAGPEGQGQKPLCIVMTGAPGGLTAVSVDVSFYLPDLLRVRALLGGEVVDTVDHAAPFPEPLLVGPLGSVDGVPLGVSNICSSGYDGLTDVGYCVAAIHLPVPQPVTLNLSAPPVTSDEIIIILPNHPPDPITPIQAIEMRGANVSQIVVVDEALGVFGNPHRGLGQAMLSSFGCPGCTLTVSNIGSSGKDGVSIDPLPPVETLGLDLMVPLDPVLPYDLGYAMTGATPGGPLVTRLDILQPEGAPLVIATDFSQLGATSQTVEAFAGETLVATVLAPPGMAGQTTDTPECIIWDIKDSCAHGETHWPLPVPIQLPGQPVPVTADRLRMTPNPPAGAGLPALESIDSAVLLAGGIDPIAITGELTVPIVPCPWDCADGDGVVGILDFLALLSQWGSAGTPCDFDGAGVGILDFLALLANWGPCG